MTHTDTPTVDTSADTIAALLHDLYHSDMACALTHQAAQVIEALRADFARLTAERDAALAGAVEVRTLAWIDNPDQALDCWMVDDFGLYQITDELVLFTGHESTGRKFDTLEAAKTAAQADYEARILAAIQPDTEALEMAEAAAFSAGYEADRWTISCGICGLIGPALAPDLSPSTGCLHGSDVPEDARVCYPARVMVLEHALRRALAPECFDHQGKILPDMLADVLKVTHIALALSAAALRGDAAVTKVQADG